MTQSTYIPLRKFVKQLAWGCAIFLFLFLFCPALTGQSDAEERINFLAIGDPQYLAEKTDNPTSLDPNSKVASKRFIRFVQQLPGTVLETGQGTTSIPRSTRGMIVAGDLINSLDKHGGPYPAMQRYEWNRYKSDFGLARGKGRIGMPVYEVYGNHDGPQGNSFLVNELKRRNKRRSDVVHISDNGIHYSWDWGPVHFVATGMFVGEGDEKKDDHHYAPRNSLEFLKSDLREQVGDSGRPVVIVHHLDLGSNDYDWPDEDKRSYLNTMKKYNVIGIVHGHTHGDPRMYNWNGMRVFDTDDACASKIHNGKPVGLRHGFLYMSIVNRPGVKNDRFHIWSFYTTDNWKTSSQRNHWNVPVSIP